MLPSEERTWITAVRKPPRFSPSSAPRGRSRARATVPRAPEQILAARESRDRAGLQLATGIPAEQDAIFALELLERAPDDHRLVARSFTGRAIGGPQVLVFDVVERH